MCGILATYAPVNRLSPEAFGVMRDTLFHRGPDDYGFYRSQDGRTMLGHRRLTIIDLSEAGRQPLHNEDKTIWVVFNGEIYNFQSLRSELERAGHTFVSNTDTEVIVHAYEAWGDDCVQRFNGMFAFVVLDERRNRLFLARDRLGIKPLFYYWDGTCFAIASEIKAIRALPKIDAEFDMAGLSDYLTYGYIPAPKTAYKRIRKLLPGHTLSFEGRPQASKPYWQLSFENRLELLNGDAKHLLSRKLETAVEAQMVSDVPVGVLLSGGIDSSTVTYFAKQHSNNGLITCSVGFDDEKHSETQYAKLIAEHLSTQYFEATIGSDSVMNSLQRTAWMYDEPYADSSAMPTYEVCRLARRQIKVALSGDGGDEVFCGYRRFATFEARQAWPRAPWLGVPAIFHDRKGYGTFRFMTAASELEQYGSMVDYFSPSEKRQLLDGDLARELGEYDDYWYFRQHWREDLDVMTRLQYLDLKTYLPDDILTKVDRASMAVSLEVRPALLDHEIVEFGFSMPAGVHYQKGHLKHLLKQSMEEKLPDAIIHRGKKGFSVPWQSWVEPNREFIEGFLINGEAVKQGLLNQKFLTNKLLHASGAKIWTILVLEQWLRNESQFVYQERLNG